MTRERGSVYRKMGYPSGLWPTRGPCPPAVHTHFLNSPCGTPRALPQVMKEEMAFLKYRREVVRAWPESPRKTVFLTGIESRIISVQQQLQMVSFAAIHPAPAT